jgi:hypothetical protein
MPTRSDRYLKRAQQCEQKASAATDQNIKRQLVDVAGQWRELARQAAELDAERDD